MVLGYMRVYPDFKNKIKKGPASILSSRYIPTPCAIGDYLAAVIKANYWYIYVYEVLHSWADFFCIDLFIFIYGIFSSHSVSFILFRLASIKSILLRPWQPLPINGSHVPHRIREPGSVP